MKNSTKTETNGKGLNGGGDAAPPYQNGKQEFRRIKAELLLRSPTNPRKAFPEGPLRELAENIKIHGIKQPLLVRLLPRYEVADPDLATPEWGRLLKDGQEIDKGSPNFMRMKLAELTKGRDGKEYEIVCGERRDRAGELAGLADRPCIIEELTDKAVREIQLIENLQREDLNGLEEAQSYAQLMKEHGLSADDLAKRVGRSRSHVFGKLALLKLEPEVKQAIEAGQIAPSVGELIGRYGKKQQVKALKLVTEKAPVDGWEGGKELQGQMSVRQASRLLADFVLPLDKAPFDTEETYHTAKGEKLTPCAACLHRSGNCVDEWPELKSPDVCTETSCYHRKEEACAAALLQPYRDKGLKVLGAKESQTVFRYSYQLSGGYMDGSETVYADKKRRPVREVLKEMPEPIMAIKGKRAVKLYRAEDVDAKLKELGLKGENSSRRMSKEEEAFEEAVRVETTKRLMARILEELQAEKDAGALLRRYLLAKHEDGNASTKDVLDLFGETKAVTPALNGMKAEQLARVLWLEECIGYSGELSDYEVKQVAKRLEIDGNELEKQTRKDLKQPNLAKLEEKAAAKGNVKAQGKGAKGKGKK